MVSKTLKRKIKTEPKNKKLKKEIIEVSEQRKLQDFSKLVLLDQTTIALSDIDLPKINSADLFSNLTIETPKCTECGTDIGFSSIGTIDGKCASCSLKDQKSSN